MATAAFKEAYLELVPEFERATGHKVSTKWVTTVQIPNRLKAGEAADLVIMSAAGIDELIALGFIARGDRIDLATCGVGVAVRAGAPKPDISSAAALKRTLRAASAIAYSTGPSGVYIAQLIQHMGIAEELKSKLKQTQGEPTGAVVARGEAEIAFQQVCELLPVPGIEFLGPLPAEIQRVTVFAAGIHVAAREPEAARALVKFFTAPAAAPVIRGKGMEPV
jgi:molybdate transport system substrate-binding protein